MKHTQWQSLLRLGNDCFVDKQWDQAKFFYCEAYDLLSHSYQRNPLSSEVLMAWICTCHNLSSLYETVGHLESSLKFLMLPHEYLKSISESSVSDEDTKLIAFKGMTLTLPAILLFVKNHPICDSCKSKFENLQQLIELDTALIH